MVRAASAALTFLWENRVFSQKSPHFSREIFPKLLTLRDGIWYNNICKGGIAYFSQKRILNAYLPRSSSGKTKLKTKSKNGFLFL